MSKQVIITGVKISDQKAKAQEILNKHILPKEALFQERKKKGQLSGESISILNSDAGFDYNRGM